MDRRATDRLHAGASDPHQSADRGDAKGRKAVPAVGNGDRSSSRRGGIVARMSRAIPGPLVSPHVAGAHAGYTLDRSPDEQREIRDLPHPHVAGAHAGYAMNRSPDEQSDIRDLSSPRMSLALMRATRSIVALISRAISGP